MQAQSTKESKNSLAPTSTNNQQHHNHLKLVSPQVCKTISSQMKTFSSFSLKSVVEAHHMQTRHTITTAGGANQMMLKGGKTRATKAVACPPDQSICSTTGKQAGVAISFSQKATTLKKRRSQEHIASKPVNVAASGTASVEQ